MTDFVNGAYALDYSQNDRKLVTQYPQHLDPYDISLLRYANYQAYRAKCYFKRSKSVRIYVNFSSSEEKEYLFLDEEDVQEVKRNERMAAEALLSSMWSPELPMLFQPKTLRKSASWNSIRLGSLRSLKQTRSFREVRGTREVLQPGNAEGIARTTSRSNLRGIMRGLFQM